MSKVFLMIVCAGVILFHRQNIDDDRLREKNSTANIEKIKVTKFLVQFLLQIWYNFFICQKFVNKQLFFFRFLFYF